MLWCFSSIPHTALATFCPYVFSQNTTPGGLISSRFGCTQARHPSKPSETSLTGHRSQSWTGQLPRNLKNGNAGRGFPAPCSTVAKQENKPKTCFPDQKLHYLDQKNLLRCNIQTNEGEDIAHLYLEICVFRFYNAFENVGMHLTMNQQVIQAVLAALGGLNLQLTSCTQQLLPKVSDVWRPGAPSALRHPGHYFQETN